MPATTIRLEPDLVKMVTTLKQRDESISGYVCELIEREHWVQAQRDAAIVYQNFLAENPVERTDMEIWESSR